MCGHEEIIDYWFIGNEFRSFWFKKDKKVDEYIQEKFNILIKKAENNQLNHWKDTPQSFLALVILLDQFSRNIYRNNILKIEINDRICLEFCKEIISKDFDKRLSFSQKIFLLLPFRHSKDLYNIYYCIKRVALYKKKEVIDRDKTNLFNKFIIASIKDLKNNSLIKKFI